MRAPFLLSALLLALALIAAACAGASEVDTGAQPTQTAGASEGDAAQPIGILPTDVILTFEGSRYEAVDLVPIPGPPVDRMVEIGVAELADGDSQREIMVYRRLGEPGPAIYTETFDPVESPGGGQGDAGRGQLWIRWLPAE